MIRGRKAPNAMLFPVKQKTHPSARPDLCLATIPPGGRSSGWDRFTWEERPFGALVARLTVDERLCRNKVRVVTLAEATTAYRPDPKCPECGSGWRHRVLATVSGYRDRIVLRDTVWVDETYISDTDLSKGYGQERKGGLSRQKLCIRVAIDVHKKPVAVDCGHGKPGSARVRKAVGGRIAPGSPLIRDLERAHNALVRDGGLEIEAHRADVNGPVYLERMEMVNDLCSWPKRCLWRFTGISPRNHRAHLDWYVYLFRVNQARDRWGPTARVVRHILMADATYRSLGWVRRHLLSKKLLDK